MSTTKEVIYGVFIGAGSLMLALTAVEVTCYVWSKFFQKDTVENGDDAP